jgi:uncharacterized protein
MRGNFLPFVLRKVCSIFLVFVLFSNVVLLVWGSLVPIEWVDEIEYYALLVDQETSAEIVVVVLQSLSGHGLADDEGRELSDIVHLGVFIFNELPLETYDGDTIVGIGKEGKDNGVLVLIAIEEQQWRIEIGYGLEGEITDIESNRIAQEYLVPQLSLGNIGEGLYDTVVALGQEIPVSDQTFPGQIRGTYYYEQELGAEGIPFWETEWFIWLVIIIMILLGVSVGTPVVRRGGRRSRGGRSGGGGSKGRW